MPKKMTKLYKGEVELEFDPFKHKYTLNGIAVPSVTAILGIISKPALVGWAAGCAVDSCREAILPGVSYDEIELQTIFELAKKSHWQKKSDAGNIGTFLHKWIEGYINGENPGTPVNEGLKEAVVKFLAWVEKHQVKFILSEQLIYSRKFNYAGTLDFICKIDGKLYLGDFKTSNSVYSEYLVQTAAYRYARHEEFPDEDYMGQLILRIGKDGSWEIAVVRDNEKYEEMLKGFLAAQKLYLLMESLKTYEAEKE